MFATPTALLAALDLRVNERAEFELRPSLKTAINSCRTHPKVAEFSK